MTHFDMFGYLLLSRSHRDVIYLGWSTAPARMSSNARAVARSQPVSTPVHMEPK
jgi:hypothetical protein